MFRTLSLIVLLGALFTFATGCHGKHHRSQWSSIDQLVAVVSPTAGNNATGWVKFTQVEGGVRVTAEVSGLTPNASHGFHVHEFGDATGSDGKTAGGHYNPQGHDHSLPGHALRHAGDLGNLAADANGVARYNEMFDNITLVGMPNPIIGRGVIVHAQQDDGGQPTGNAGARIGIGVIGIAKPAE